MYLPIMKRSWVSTGAAATHSFLNFELLTPKETNSESVLQNYLHKFILFSMRCEGREGHRQLMVSEPSSSD